MKKMRSKLVKRILALIGFGSAALGMFFIMTVAIIFTMIAGAANSGSATNPDQLGSLNPEVIAYLPMVSKYAAKYKIPEYVNLALCIMQIESDGRGLDPMQSSECGFNTKYLPLGPGMITDPEYSVEVGVQYLADTLRIAKCKGPEDIPGVSLTCQGYNYGPGYIYWAARRGGYTKSNAIEFSEMMKAETGWGTYGNPEYVDRIMRFYPGLLLGGAGGGATGDIFPDNSKTEFLWPLPNYDVSWITCWYGQNGHNGFDIAAPEGTPIVAAEAGTVDSAEYHYSWGNNVYITHNGTYGTRYAHMIRWAVSPGQTVRRGQVIGYVGNTGNSFGNHLHFELYQNGVRIDPYPYIS